MVDGHPSAILREVLRAERQAAIASQLRNSSRTARQSLASLGATRCDPGSLKEPRFAATLSNPRRL